MIRFCTRIAGDVININTLEGPEDVAEFVTWVRLNEQILGCDTETTGLDWWADDFRLRTVQFGNATESYVLPVENHGALLAAAVGALRHIKTLVFQNAPYDLLVLDATTDLDMEELWPKIRDTKIYAHLVDNRSEMEGGTGHSLFSLTKAYIDNDMAAKIKGSMVEIAKSLKTTKEKVWKLVPWDHGGYMTYSGLDPVLAFRLFYKLKRALPQSVYKRSYIGDGIGWMDLPTFEHKVAEICSYMSRRGIRLDIEYTENLIEELRQREAEWTQVCRDLGVENPWSIKQLMDHWFDNGDQPFDERHPEVFYINGSKERAHQTWVSFSKKTGALSLSDDLLKKMEEVGDVMAMAVRRAKSARKKRTTWLENFLSQVDSKGFVHPGINSIQATTARMSITGIPAQTLPAGEAEIRNCFLADWEEIICSTDYSNMELRFLAAHSGDERMLKAFENGEDLHQVTADGAGVSRKIGKLTNFLVVFGGGPPALASQAGISLAAAEEVIESFKRTFPGVAEFMKAKAREARTKGFVTTPSGRRLFVDRRLAFRGTNYFVQSGSRDITCRALLRLAAAGLRDRMLLPIHDEILFTLPKNKSLFGAKLTAKMMQEEVRGLMIPTDPEIARESWGSIYELEEASKH